MDIRETFATRIEERIEPVVKVANRKPATVLNELANLVVTLQWEKYLHRMLEEYTEAFEREDEGEIGLWISGFFGSGKSLLMKIFGILLQGGEINGQDLHQLFLSRLGNSQDRKDFQRFLAVCQRKLRTFLVGGNLHAIMATGNDPLALIAFKLFAEERNYTRNWAFAWAIEYHIDSHGRTTAFRERVCELSGITWEEVAQDSDIYGEDLNRAAAEIMPEHFSNATVVQDAVSQTFQRGISPQNLIERLRRWCQNQDKEGRRHKILLQLDELGQWLQSGSNPTQRAMEIQALIETASNAGAGRVWIAVTAHGDVQALKENIQQEIYAKINQRFDIQCRLSNEDIDNVVRERLLRKTQPAASLLRERFQERRGEITDLGSLERTRRTYHVPTEENFADFYPYLPWMINVIPNIVKGIAQAANRSESLTGSNRTMIGVVQGGIIETPGFLNRSLGSLLSLADLYDQLSSDAPVETRTDILRIQDSVKDASEYTTRVARALYLLGQDEHIPCTLRNVTLALVSTLDANLNNERAKVKIELERLVSSGYVKQVGEIYVFLSTQQRSFQDKVRRREQELYNKNYDLSSKLKEFDKEDSLRFDRIPPPGKSGQAGQEKLLKIEVDTRVVHNPTMPVTVRAYSPMQYYLDQDLSNDTVMKQRSNQEPNTFFFRMGEVKELRRALARWVATTEVVDEVNRSGVGNDYEKRVAQQTNDKDLPVLKESVRYTLAQAVQEGKIFLHGTSYELMDGSNPQEMVRNTLSYLLFSIIYTRFHQLPHRLVNEVTAVKAALHDNTSNSDLQALGVYNADGSLNESSALISTLKGLIPLAEGDRGAITADELRQKLEQPPYGWDGNAARVGLALLLRFSHCRLLENSVYLTDPQSKEVEESLIKANRFKALQVQGVRSELKTQERADARSHALTIFGVKLSMADSTLNIGLGEQLKALQQQAEGLQEWATTAVCPLPSSFQASYDLVAEMLTSSAPGIRIPYFIREWEAIAQYKQLLQELSSFKNEQGGLYIQIRDFFNRIVDAEGVTEAVTAFIQDWRTLRQERTITQAKRWSDLLTAYHIASQALTQQTGELLNSIRQESSELRETLRKQLVTAGVPEDRLDEELATLERETGIQQLQANLEQQDISYGEARRLRNELAKLRMNLPLRMRELSTTRYQPKASNQPTPTPEIYLNWQKTMGQIRFASAIELDQAIEKLRRSVINELIQGKVVIIE